MAAPLFAGAGHVRATCAFPAVAVNTGTFGRGTAQLNMGPFVAGPEVSALLAVTVHGFEFVFGLISTVTEVPLFTVKGWKFGGPLNATAYDVALVAAFQRNSAVEPSAAQTVVRKVTGPMLGVAVGVGVLVVVGMAVGIVVGVAVGVGVDVGIQALFNTQDDDPTNRFSVVPATVL